MSTQKAQKRRHERYRQQKHQARQWAAAANALLKLTPGGLFCLHYQHTAAARDGWLVMRAAGRGGCDVAVCPDCMTRLFGPDWADLLSESGQGVADLLRKVA